MSASSKLDMLDHVLLPVATASHAHRIARALEPYEPTQVTVTHVVEKGEGVPDKTAVEHSRDVAEKCYETVRRAFPEAEEYTTYGRNVVATIIDAAEEVDASAIACVPRGGGGSYSPSRATSH